ncbi:MAG: Omp28-related outer membrane protein [Alloprevotella sp.]|nr:Omp28-related outer membrane protein [Alloprevotella sp.]
MNIRPYILLTVCFLLSAVCLRAQSQWHVGYCPEEIPAETKAYGTGVETTRLSAAIRLPRTKMLRYQGGYLTAIRFAVKAEGLSAASVWVRGNLNERSRIVQSVTELHDGWNEIVLNNPLPIDGNELYIGYTLSQAAEAKGVISDGSGSEDASFIATDNDWLDMHLFGVGTLFIQAVVKCDVPTRDMATLSFNAPTLVPTESPAITLTTSVENLGDATTENVTVSYLLDGLAIGEDNLPAGLQTEETKTLTHQIALPCLTPGTHRLAAAVSLGTTPDERTANDTLLHTFYAYAESYPRNVLLEHFTSIPCVNCPETDKLLEEVVPQRDDIVWTAHHVGYRDDQFTIEAARALTAFGVIGNPEIMLDRRTLPKAGSNTPAFVLTPGDKEALQAFLDDAAAEPAFARLDVEATADGLNLNVAVNAEATDFFTSLYPDVRLCLFIVEDQCQASIGQAGDPMKFTHDNVVRAIPTTASGQAVRFDAGTLQTTFTLAKASEWNTDNLRAVAFLCQASARGSSLPTGSVLNAAQASFINLTGIKEATTVAGQQNIFDLQGRKLTKRPGEGLFIEGGRVCYATATRNK